MTEIQAPTRYSLASRLFHWSMAAAIAAGWLIGQTLEDAPRGAARDFNIGLHVLIGLTVLALVLPRLLTRVLGGVPADANPPGWIKRLGDAAHLLLYVLMLVLPLTGLAAAMTGRAPLPVLGLFEVPPLLNSFGIRKLLEEVHGVLANVMLGTVVLHVAATLWHAFIRRDGVAQRMLPAFLLPGGRPAA